MPRQWWCCYQKQRSAENVTSLNCRVQPFHTALRHFQKIVSEFCAKDCSSCSFSPISQAPNRRKHGSCVGGVIWAGSPAAFQVSSDRGRNWRSISGSNSQVTALDPLIGSDWNQKIHLETGLRYSQMQRPASKSLWWSCDQRNDSSFSNSP